MAFIKQRDMKPQRIAEKRTRCLAHTEHLMMVQIDFEDGPHQKPDPPHTHPHEQISYIVSGKVLYFLGEEQSVLEAGDMVTVPAHIPHTIQVLSEKARLADAFYPLREDFLKP